MGLTTVVGKGATPEAALADVAWQIHEAAVESEFDEDAVEYLNVGEARLEDGKWTVAVRVHI